MPTVLVADDDPTVRQVLGDYLRRAGLDVVAVPDGAAALAAAGGVDVAVLDVMMGPPDGLEVCRRLRADPATAHLPVIVLTALGDEVDRIVGFETGADDYVAKPFSPRELVLRVQSVLRRSAPAEPAGAGDRRRDGDLDLDPVARRAWRAGEPLHLTARELDLLLFWLDHPGQVFSRDELMRRVWGWSFGDESTVTVHVRRLREKVEADPSAPIRLVTVWGAGYRWDAS